MITVCVKALLVGMAFGAVVRLCGLPVPAPPTAAGVLGVAGVTIGFVLMGRWL